MTMMKMMMTCPPPSYLSPLYKNDSGQGRNLTNPTGLIRLKVLTLLLYSSSLRWRAESSASLPAPCIRSLFQYSQDTYSLIPLPHDNPPTHDDHSRSHIHHLCHDKHPDYWQASIHSPTHIYRCPSGLCRHPAAYHNTCPFMLLTHTVHSQHH